MKAHKTDQILLLCDLIEADPERDDEELMEETGLCSSTVWKYRRMLGHKRPPDPSKLLPASTEDKIKWLLTTSRMTAGDIAAYCGVSAVTVRRRGIALGIDMVKRARQARKPPKGDPTDQGMCGEVSRYWLGRPWRTNDNQETEK